jgi:signal transduction histidine kinase/MFS family permease
VRVVSWRRLVAAGLGTAVLVVAVGFAIEWRRFGTGTSDAFVRVEAEVSREFAEMTARLTRLGDDIAADPMTAQSLQAARAQASGPEAARALFDVVDRHLGSARNRSDVAVTIYDYPDGVARAWAGRPSDIPAERIHGARDWFVTPSPQGLRLVHVVPVSANDDAPVGIVATEHALTAAPVAGSIAPTDYLFPTAFGDAALRLGYEGAGERPRADAVLLRAPTGDVLLEATLLPGQIAAARASLRRTVAAAVLAVLASTLLLLMGPVLDRRATLRDTAGCVRLTIVAVALLGGTATLAWFALVIGFDGAATSDALLLIAGGALAGAAAVVSGPVARLAAAMRSRRRDPRADRAALVTVQLAAGCVAAALFALFAFVLGRTLDQAPVDLRHFTLHPWSVVRLTLLAAILAGNLAVMWLATLTLAGALARWRVPRTTGWIAAVLLLWIAPSLLVGGLAAAREWPLPALGIGLAAMASAAAALVATRATRWYRHATVAARILALFLAFLVPALLLYPSVNFFTVRAIRAIIATQYAVEAQNHPQMLQERLKEVQDEIDAMAGLAELVQAPPAATPERAPESAFQVWRQTALARARLTSAVELYGAEGDLVSRFALNFPEYSGTVLTSRVAATCQWEVFGEAARFGSEERRMLHAERHICAGPPGAPRVMGSIVLHIVPDYRTLPFITSQSPYFEVFRTQGGAPAEGTTGSEVEIVIYGWGLTPIYASGGAAWPITAELFERIYGSREPFWTEMNRGNTRWHVYFSNDRNGIYGLGYPALSLFDRLVHLAELATLAGALFVIVLVATALFTRAAREQPRVGRALLREIRASFYRKLFLAFVLASIIPVLTLAFVIRAYFAGLLRANVEAEAARSASVAQRVIEESQELQRRSGEALPPASDDVMIWISQVIDQDVNIFRGPELLVTSERDLFASGLLPTRTPADVYRAIALQRLPSFVGEDRIATMPYMIAATPVRAGGRDEILTVPLANQQRNIEREVDELDRGVHLAALFFILLGAGIGLSMAERIADPVRRLTRATRRIASGDFDARIAVRSADELRRLVDAFNSMAAELKAQRTQLERTHRLEAWAEMARQVAHEIKNPLTPIQLSAEHLRRVHADRGQPLGDVLEGCVTTILGQVRLLRQISAEFSNFASSPIARPGPVDLPDLVAEVVDPYRAGLTGRVEIRNDVRAPLRPAFVDRTLIGRALANIVENALHAMPGPGEIAVAARDDGDAIELRIRDTGLGMDDEALARVFEPYFSTKATGTGLGLPIARRNVELSGGRIEVESEKGRGTTVILRLPVAG